MTSRNQGGFSPVTILLVLLLTATLAFTVLRVYDSKDTRSSTPPSSSDASSDPAPVDDPDLAYVRPPSEVYRVAQPEGWVKSTCSDSPDLLFLAPSTDKLGKCNSESGGTVLISKSAGDIREPATAFTGNPQYTSVSYEATTIDGMAGYKVAYAIAATGDPGYPPPGTKHIQYVLFDGTNSFIIIHTRLPADPDLSAIVQTMAETFDKV